MRLTNRSKTKATNPKKDEPRDKSHAALGCSVGLVCRGWASGQLSGCVGGPARCQARAGAFSLRGVLGFWGPVPNLSLGSVHFSFFFFLGGGGLQTVQILFSLPCQGFVKFGCVPKTISPKYPPSKNHGSGERGSKKGDKNLSTSMIVDGRVFQCFPFGFPSFLFFLLGGVVQVSGSRSASVFTEKRHQDSQSEANSFTFEGF